MEATKDKITFFDNGTVYYEPIETFYFEESMSVGKETDSFTTVNIVLIVRFILFICTRRILFVK